MATNRRARFVRWWRSIRRCQYYDPTWRRQCEKPLDHSGPHGVA